MMARRTILAGLAGGTAALLAGCGLLGGNKYRFRMTVEVQTPQGLRSGSGVYEVYASGRLALTSEEAEISDGLKGEATVVDLPGGPLFVLLKPGPGEWPRADLNRAATVALSGRMFIGLDDLIAMVGDLGSPFSGRKTAELPRKDYPLMVRFRDINDPRSVERVDPAAIGVKRIVLETTSDEVTTGIEKRLGWLGKDGPKGNVVSGPTINPHLEETIRFYDFGSEFK